MQNRSRKRGAAMPEAIIVITVLLVFLGMITWAQRAYAAKIDQANATRSDVLFYASHSCEQGPPGEDTETGPAFEHHDHDTPIATGSEDTTTADTLAGALPAEGPGALKRDWNMASTMREQTVDGSAIVDLEKKKLSTHVKTQSWVACNEKNYGGNWTDLAQFVWDMKDNGAGLLGP